MPANSSATQHRILIIDDNAAIHGDFLKILGQKRPSEDMLREMESELFGQKEPPCISSCPSSFRNLL